MRRKKGKKPIAPEGGDARITPVDVQQVEFRLAFRGYNERDVDAFLDRITEDLASYLEENERLRGGMGAATVGRVSIDDAGGAEADAILARAREEASAIVRRAEQEAAAIRAVGGARGDARAAVAPFLNSERDFLQSLGSLVQTHAEDIKQMVLSFRARAESGAEPTGGDREPTGRDREPTGRDREPTSAVAEGASASEIRGRLGEPRVASIGEEAEEDADEADRAEPAPVVLEDATEPAYSSEGAPVNEGRERSLRELFWGED